jgi:hypothetical protein
VIDVDDEGWVEDRWCGRTVRIGTAVVQPAVPRERCTMVTRPQPGLDRDLDVFKTLARHHGATFGVWTAVQTPGARACRRRGDTQRLTVGVEMQRAPDLPDGGCGRALSVCS